MKFERLELENFASYYGKHKIDLTCTEEKPVVVFIGGTGYGKTSLFDAINWALYGSRYEEQMVKNRQKNIFDYVNEKAIHEAKENNSYVLTSATLYFEHDSFHYYILQEMSTKITINGNGNLQYKCTDRMTALYKITSKGNHEQINYNEIFLDELLPTNVKDYFLFDGDRIYQLSNPASSKEVRDAIYRVVDLEILEKSIKHYREVEKEFRKMAKQASTDDLKRICERHESVVENLLKQKEKAKELDNELFSLKNQILGKEKLLQEMPEAKELQIKKNEMRRELIELDERDKGNALKMRKLIAPAALEYASDACGELLQELEKQREKGTIPQKVSIKLLVELLEIQECLCGTKLTTGTVAYNNISEKLTRERNKNTGEELLSLLYKLTGTSKEITRAKIEMYERAAQHDRNMDERREIDMILKQIDQSLEKMPNVDVARTQQEIRNMSEEKESLIRRIERQKIEIEREQEEIKKIENEREELGQQQKKALKLQRRENLAREAANELEKLYESFAEESRKSIEDLTKKEFQNFVKSGSGYDVRLNKDYALEVVDSNGNPALSRLSMGQSQCLSLSFITSIAKVSEKNPPLVIDMPFGRLDRDVHKQVSGRLTELASQLILFLIPEIEWNEVTAKILQNKSSYIYKLSFDERTRETAVERVC